MRARLLFASLLALVAASAAAQTARVDPLLAVHETDPLELAHAVDRLGDAAIVERLGEGTPIAVRALAVAATPRLHQPEQALAPLAAIAQGRDPDLAPRAAQAALTIATSLDERTLDAHEVDRAELTPARTALAAIAADATARADLRRAAGRADAALADLGIPEP
ncbi:MAG: hypothetical protein U0234_32750 [Sandaracinus sp.]